MPMTACPVRYGSWTLVYDDESRLKQSTSPSGTDYYYWNLLGQRYQDNLSGIPHRYVYDGDRIVLETDDAGTIQARYTTASGSYFAPFLHMTRGSTSVFPTFDAVGAVRHLVNTSGTITDSYTADVFGQQLSSSGSTVNPYQYGGEWGYITDPSGLLQLGARFYWPEVGRFVSQDPARDEMNWYSYVNANPVTRIDPAGLLAVPCRYMRPIQ